jgi:hypothetical protein
LESLARDKHCGSLGGGGEEEEELVTATNYQYVLI